LADTWADVLYFEFSLQENFSPWLGFVATGFSNSDNEGIPLSLETDLESGHVITKALSYEVDFGYASFDESDSNPDQAVMLQYNLKLGF